MCSSDLMAHATVYGVRRAGADATAADTVLPEIQLPEGVLAEFAGKAVVSRLGIAVPRGGLARALDEAHEIAQCVGFPVVLKAQSGELAHKSDAGGVILGIADQTALAAAWQRLHAAVAAARPGLALDGVLVEAMAPSGLEMIVGGRRDPDWGPVLIAGLGGVWVEALDDVRLMPPDLSPAAFAAELSKLKGVALLHGLRGRPPADLAAVADTLAKIGALLRAHPEVKEIELNPLVVYPTGVLALDVLLITAPAGPLAPTSP